MLAQPVPFPYFHLLSLMLWIQLFLIGYSLACMTAPPYFTIPLMVLISLVLAGMRSLAVQLSNPFGTDSVDFDCFVKLYVNHRPVFGVGKAAIATGFSAIGADVFGQMPREALSRALASHGETLSAEDLAQCLRALTGVDDLEALLGPKQQLDAPTFAEKILGFEDYVS